MSFRKILVGIFMAGIICCGIGAGVMFILPLNIWEKKRLGAIR